jgi:hypothetical protein
VVGDYRYFDEMVDEEVARGYFTIDKLDTRALEILNDEHWQVVPNDDNTVQVNIFYGV